MAKWNLNFNCNISVSVNGIDGNTKEEAIRNAIELVKDITILSADDRVDEGMIEGEMCKCTFAKKVEEGKE